MIFNLEINGTPKFLKAGTYRKTETANRRCTASFQLDSVDRSYRPAEGSEVLIEVDGMLAFGGLVDKPRERGMGGPRFPGISTDITAVDFQIYAERRFVNLTLAAGTLKSQLATLVTTYLATPYGVTLDAGQVVGPSMPELTYTYKRFDVVMKELMTLTADFGQPFIWEIGYDKVFQAYQPSTDAAPFDLVGNDLSEVVGDIEVGTARSDQYANRIILQVAPKTELEREEVFTQGVDPYPYVSQYTVLKHYGYITYSGTGNMETLRTPDDPDSASWTFDPATGELERDAGAPSGGATTTFKFDGTFSGVWIAEDAVAIADPNIRLVERVIGPLDSIPNDVTGQAFADAELARRSAAIKTVKYVTWEEGLTIGQQQTINVSSRGVNGSAVIVDISTRDLVHRLEHTVTAVIDSTQTNLGSTFQDDYDIWFGNKGGGGSTTVGAGGSAGPHGPERSVQTKQQGKFHGDASFTYNKDTNSVIGGLDSTIADELVESSQAWGKDNHIITGAVISGPENLIADVSAGSSDGISVTTAQRDTTGAGCFLAFCSNIIDNVGPTDSEGNTWVPLGAYTTLNGGVGEWYYCNAPDTSATHTFTLTTAPNTRKPTLHVLAFSGSIVEDADSGDQGNAITTLDPIASITPGQAVSLLVTGIVLENSDTATVDAAFTKVAQVNYDSGTHMGSAVAYELQSSAIPRQPAWSWTTSGVAATHFAVFAYTPPDPEEIVGTVVFGEGGTARGTRQALFSLRGGPITVDLDDTVYIDGDLVVTGTTTIELDAEVVLSKALFDEDGALVIDEDGNLVFSE